MASCTTRLNLPISILYLILSQIFCTVRVQNICKKKKLHKYYFTHYIPTMNTKFPFTQIQLNTIYVLYSRARNHCHHYVLHITIIIVGYILLHTLFPFFSTQLFEVKVNFSIWRPTVKHSTNIVHMCFNIFLNTHSVFGVINYKQ